MNLIQEAIETGKDLEERPEITKIDILVPLIQVLRIKKGFSRLFRGLSKRELSLSWYEASKINWHGWDDPLTVKAERKDKATTITMHNKVYGETFELRGNRASLSAFQIVEGEVVPTTLVGRSQEENHSGIPDEWANYIDRLTE